MSRGWLVTRFWASAASGKHPTDDANHSTGRAVLNGLRRRRRQAAQQHDADEQIVAEPPVARAATEGDVDQPQDEGATAT